MSSTLTELFNPNFLMILGIILLIAALVFYYEGKIREQNHKISSMLSLVSSLAEEMNSVRYNMNTINNMMVGGFGMPFPNSLERNLNEPTKQNELIAVSDDEDSDDESESGSESNGDEENTDDEESNSDESSEEDDDEENYIEIGDNEINDIKVLNIKIHDFNINDIEQNSNDDLDDIEEIDDLEDLNDLDENNLEEELTSNFIGEPEELVSLQYDESIKNINIEPMEEELSSLNVKTIHLSNLDENKPQESNVFDYKKLSLNKLRSVVLDKGLTTDSSKLKKHELLKLLGVE